MDNKKLKVLKKKKKKETKWCFLEALIADLASLSLCFNITNYSLVY